MSIFESEDLYIDIGESKKKELKENPLNTKPDFIFDTQFYNKIKNYNWYRNKSTIQANMNNTTISLQKFIMNIITDTEAKECTQKIKNFDYRITNLFFTSRNTISNRKRSKNNYRGVRQRGNKYQASVSHNKKNICLGSYNTPEEAAEAYNKKAKELFGKFAYQNVILKPKKSKQEAKK
jgi:hypothetical protein